MGVMLATIYNFDPSIFDGVEFPSNISVQDFVDSLLMQCGEMPVLYSSPPLLKSLIQVWSNISQYSWNRLAATLTAEYNPIENYDRMEEWQDNSINNSRYTNSTNNTSNGSTKEQVYGYNNLQTPADNSASTSASTSADTSDSAGNTTITGSRKGRAHGNIGVTTTQEMLESERRVAMFNFYDAVIRDFQKRFLIWVY